MFDPKWAGDNRIVFASYEKGGIAVRMLKDVIKLIDTPYVSKVFDFGKINDLWAIIK